MNKFSTTFKTLLYLSAALFCVVNAAFAQNNCLKIGQNVTGLQFKDIFKENIGWRFPGTSPTAVCSGIFGAPACPEQPILDALPKDANGYVTGGIPYNVSGLQTSINNTYSGTITHITTYMQRETYSPYALGDYYVFWQGQGTLEFFWNDGNGMIKTVTGSFGTIPAANGYELNFGVPNVGITSLDDRFVSSNNSAGVHYCRITVPSTTGNPARDPYNNTAGIGMRITSSAVAPNHIRGISVVQPDFGTNSGGYNGQSKFIADGAAARTFVNSGPEHFKTQPFHPAFINWIKVFPAFRFKDVVGVDGETPKDISWSKVRSYDYYTQTAQIPDVGHPYNYMYIIQLCNMLKKDCWINGFVLSDENYQKNLGKLFRDNLDPSLKVYLELSNENTWNFFPGFNGPPLINNYAQATGMDLFDAASFLENRFWVNFGDSWKGEDQDRIVRVVAGQAVNPFHVARKTQYHEARGERYDMLSVAWYLDQIQTNGRTIPQNGTPLQLLNAMIADNNYNRNQDSYTDFPSISKIINMHAGLARAKGKKMALYEGGTHHSFEQRVGGVDRSNWDRSRFVKWLPEIRTFYKSLLDTIRNYPEVEMAMQFNLFGGSGTTLSNGQIVEDHSFGFVPGPFSDTTATGNKSYTGLEFGNINILGTNAHGVWKELVAQNKRWQTDPICTPTITSDIVGSGLSLDFVSPRNQFVTVNGANLFDPLATNNYTIETWIMPKELERQQTVWAYANGPNVINALNITALNKIQWNIGNGAVVLDGPLVERNKWYHVSLVKNGANVQMHVNGSLVATGAASGSAGVPTNLTMGASRTSSVTDFYRGQIDEFKVWSNTSLALPLIRDYMCKKVTPTHPNYASLTSYFEFNSISGNNLMDKVANAPRGSLINFGAPTIGFGYVQSGAPIGDLSTNIYPGSWTNTDLSFTNPVGGDVINVNGIGAGNPDGIHIYVVNESPTLNVKPQFYTSIAGKYFGVFAVNGNNPTYNINYGFQGNASASPTVGFNRLVKRDAGSDYTWDNSGARIDPLNRSLITNCTESYRSEYILGVRQNQLIQRPGAGACISLPGTTLGVFNNFNRPDVYTISFWVKGAGDGVIGFRDPFTERYINYRAGAIGDDYVVRYVDLSLNNVNSVGVGKNILWTHYTYTRDATGLLVFYVNGVPSSSINFPGDTSMLDMVIKAGGSWAGQLDELSVWKRNLSLTEIRDLMCKKITPAHPSYCDLYAYFKFDEGSGNVLENTLGSGNIIFTGPIAWTRSGAAIGDESRHNYNAPYVTSISHPDGDNLKLTPKMDGNRQLGTQIYYVNGNPNYPIYPATETYAFVNVDTTRYYGAYAISNYPLDTDNRSFLYEYNYENNKNINLANEANLRLLRREYNSILNWTNTGANLSVASNTITYQSPNRTDFHYPGGEFILAGPNASPFVVPASGVPTIAGITGKSTLCLGETNALYKVLATVDRRARSFKWIASNGLSVSVSTTDSVRVSALAAGTQTLTVIGINTFGQSIPSVYTINVQNTGYLSANITGNTNPCNSASATYNISGVSPSPIAYIWSVTGDAINPTPNNLTPSNTFNFGSGGQSTVRISVYGQYSCGLALINTLNVNNNKLPNVNLPIVGDSLCLIDGNATIKVNIANSESGVTYTAFDGATPVATVSGNGTTQTLNVPTSILTTFVNKVISVRAQNNTCPLIPVTMATNANVMIGNILTPAQLAPTFVSPGAICFNKNNSSIRDFPLVISSGAVSGVTYTPNYLTFAQPYGEPFSVTMGTGVLAAGTSVTMTVRPNNFPFWLSFNVPNSISGLAKAPGCPTQTLSTRTSFTLNNTPEVATPSKVAGPGKDQKMDIDGSYPVCTGTPTRHYTTAKGGNVAQFNQRYFDGSMTSGNNVIAFSNPQNMTLADIAVNDVVYILGTQTDGNGLPAGNNLPQLDAEGNKIPYFVQSKTGGGIRVSATRGGGAIPINFNATNIQFWAPITIDISTGNTITIPARFGTLGLGLYSQINFEYAYTRPDGVCVGADGGAECFPTQYVASFSGRSFQLSSNPRQGNGVNSAGYFINRGKIIYTAGNPNVTGIGTIFLDEELADVGNGLGGALLRDMNNNLIGEVQSVTNDGALVLKAGAIGSSPVAGAIFSSSKRINFTSGGQSVVLSAPQDSDNNGFEWTIEPRESISNVTSVYGGGTYNPTTGVFSGGNSDAVKNGIEITWNGTYTGTAYIGVTSSKTTPCNSKSSVQNLPRTPGYEQTRISLKMQSQIPTTPFPIGFTELSFCQSQSNTSFVTNTKNATGGFQWQILNAGSSKLIYSFASGSCEWSPTSTVVGAKGFKDVNNTLGFGGDYLAENFNPCQNSASLPSAPSDNSNTISVQWQPGYTGLATIRVRALGCGSMSDAGDMKASPWVTAVVTVGGSPNPGSVNLAGQLQLCQGAAPSQLYQATGTNIDEFKYFLRRPGQIGDIEPGMIAYYPFNGNLQNRAVGVWSLGNIVDGTGVNGVGYGNNKNSAGTSAINFTADNQEITFTNNSKFTWGDPTNISSKELQYSFWLLQNGSSGERGIINKDNNYIFFIDGTTATNKTIRFRAQRNGSPFDDVTTVISGIIPNNTWTHVSISMEALVGFYRYTTYFNGVLNLVTTINSFNLFANTNNLSTRWYTNAMNPGGFDELMIHNRKLSPQDVQAIYNLDANLFTDPSDYIGEINGRTGLATWQTTFSGPAQIGVQAIGCGGSTIKTFDAFISPKPSILGISIADPTGCGNPLASGSVTITLASFNPMTFTGSPWAISWNNDLISDGSATLSGSNTLTLNAGLFAGSSVTGVTAWYNGSNGCNAPISITSRIIVGSSPPSSLIGTSLMSPAQVCSASTSSGINVLGSENNVRYYAMIGNLMVTPTVVGTGGNIQLSITGANILTATGLNQVYQIRTLAFTPGCTLVTLAGIQTITVNGASAATGAIVTGTNPVCNPATSAVSVGGVNGTIDWQSSTGGAFASTGGTVANYTTPTLTQNTTFRALVTNGACPAFTTTSALVTVNSPLTTTFTYNQPAYCNNVTTSVSPVLSNSVAGGAFTVAPSGLSLNGTTGAISVNASTAALYTVTYSYTVAGCPGLTTTTTVRIGSIPGLTFGFSPTAYCSSSTNPTPGTTFSGLGSGGTFSSTSAGLVFANTASGQVNIAGSSAGVYPLIYTVSVVGCGNVSSTVGNAITINSVPTITSSFVTNMSNCGVPDGTVTINGIGVNGFALQYQYAALAYQSGNTFGGINAGSYTPSIRYTALPACSATGAAFNISAPNTPSLSGFNLQHITNCGLTDGRATVTGAGGTLPYQFSNDNGATWVNNVGTFAGLGAASYNISIRNTISPACSATGTAYFTITTPSTPIITNVTGTAPTTCLATDGGITITGTAGSSTAEYSLNGTAWQLSNVFSGRGVGTYTGYMRNVTGSTCMVTATGPTLNSAYPQPNFGYGATVFCSTNAINTVTSLNFASNGFFKTNGISVSSVTGTIAANATQGSYSIIYTIPGAGFCLGVSTSVGITINSLPGIQFAYATPFCKNGINPIPSTTIGGVGGAFSSAPVGLSFVSTSTGEVNLTSSNAGTYNVTYSISIPGCGNIVSTVGNALTINSVPGTSISYTGSPYCNNVVSANVTALNTVVGGIYSATSGLTLNSITGLITPSTSTQGSYIVTYSYTIAGCGPQSTTTSVIVNSVPGIQFAYATPFCKNGINPIPSTTIGGVGGAFSSAPAGLSFVSTSTGEVNLTSSNAGTYNVTYSISIPGCGNIVSTVGNALTINSVPGTSISYVSPVCNSSTILGVTAINTVVGGIYTATGGLSINSITGVINPTGFGGTYTITYSYTIAGCGPQSTTTSLVVTTLPSTPTLSYGTSPYCSSSSPISLVSSTNVINGSYLSTASGFSVNATSGVISIPQNTLSGVFVIRYDIPAGGGCASVSGNNTITLSGAPNPLTINGVTATQCYNAQVVLTAMGTIPGATIQWLQDGVVVGSNTAIYTTTGLTNSSYNYVAVLNNGVCATVPSAIKTINVNQNPTISGFGASQSFACTSQSVSLSNSLSIGTVAYAINTGTGYSLLPANSYTFTNTIVGNAFSFVGYAFVPGCQTVTSPVVIVNSSTCGLTAAFSANPTPICISSAVITVTNTSIANGGTILGYTWDFDGAVGGIVNTAGPHVITFTGSGNKTIGLTIVGTGSVTNSTNRAIRVDALSTISGMSIPASPICETNTTSVLSVTALGTIQWYKSGVAQGIINTQNAGAMTSNTTFMATAVNGVCPMVTATGVVTVTNLNVGGNITGANAICASSPGLNLTITGQVGNSYTWYNSTNGGANWNTLTSNTNTIATGTLSTTTSYVVSVSGGACSNVASAPVNIIVTQTPVGGTASVDRMIVCTSDGNGGIFTLAGQSGASIQWERSVNNVTFVNAVGSNANTATFIGNNLGTIGNVFYRARVSNAGACGDVFSNVITVSGSPCDLRADFTPLTTAVCVSVGNVVTFTDASTSSNTILGYTWDFGGGTGGNVNTAGPHAITYSSTGLKNVRLTILGLGGLTNIKAGTVQVDANSIEGSIDASPAASSYCYSTTGLLTLTGFNGDQLQWILNGTTISGATTTSLVTGLLFDNPAPQYQVRVKNGVCPSMITTTFSPNIFSQAVAPTISAPASVCRNTQATINNTGTIVANSYQWQSWNGSNFTNIANATTLGFTTANLTNTIVGINQYRLEVKNGTTSCFPAYSNVVTIDAVNCPFSANATVNGAYLPTAISLENTTGSGVTFGIELIAGTVTSYNWQFTGGNVSNSINPTQAVVFNGSGLFPVNLTIIGVGGFSNIINTTLTVDAMSQAGTISGNGIVANPICYNTSDVLTLSSFVGNQIQWYNSAGIITTATGSTYTTPALTANETYYATIKNGVSRMVTATGFNVNVRPLATVTSINAPSGTICIGTPITISGSEIGINTIVGWQISTDNEATWQSTPFTSNVINIASVSTNARESYRPLVKNGMSCEIVTVSGFATINPIGCKADVSFTGYALAPDCISNASISGYTITDKTSSLAPILAWSWNFDGGIAANGNNVSAPGIVKWSTPGSKQIRLTVTIAGGNVFTTTVPGLGDFTLDALPNASLINSNASQLCSGNPLNLSITGVPTATTFDWERATTSNFASTTKISATNTANENIAAPTGTSSDYFYRLGVTNGACTVLGYSNVVTVSSTLQPSASISYQLDNCKGNSGMQNVTVTVNTLAGGSFPYTLSSGTLNSSMLDVNTGLINIANAAVGNHVVTLTANAFKGCNPISATANVNVNQYPTATITPLSINSYCDNYSGTVSVNATKNGFPTNGRFISTPNLGINTNSLTGLFVPNGKTPTSYTIYYELDQIAGCPANTSAGIALQITQRQSVSKPRYADTVYCNVGTMPLATSTSNTNGYYKLFAGLVSNTSTGGNFGINGITANTYSITYNIDATPSCDAITSPTAFVTIKGSNFNRPTLTYLSNQYCANSAASTDRPSVNPSGGRFTSTNAAVDAIDGGISFNNMPLGTTTFDVSYSYTYPGVGCLPVSTSIGITIFKTNQSALTDLTYNTTNTPKGIDGRLCNNSGLIVSKNSNFSFTGGTFSINTRGSSVGIIDPTNGNVDLGRLAEQKFTVTYTISALGVCPSLSKETFLDLTSSTFVGVANNANIFNQMCMYNREINGNRFVLTGYTTGKIAWQLKNDIGILTPLSDTTSEISNVSFPGSGVFTMQAIVTNGGCTPITKISSVTVSSAPIGGIAKTVNIADTVLCYSPLNTQVTLDGYRGTTWTWEYIYTKADYNENELDPTKMYTLNAPVLFAEPQQITTPVHVTRLFEKDSDYTSTLRYRAKVTNGACRTDEAGKDVYSSYVLIRKCKKNPFIPNALEPGSSSSENSVWDIKNLRLPENAEIKIFNRYGTEVYMMTGKDLQTRSFDGNGLPAGTYYYVIDKKDGRPFIGDLTIIR